MMKKLILTLLFILNSLLFAEQELSNNEIIELTSAFQIESNISNIDDSNLSFGDFSFDKINKNSLFNSYRSAVKIAKEENKKILLEVVADNCKFCEEMRTTVLSQDSVTKAIEKNFVFAQANADRESLPLGLDEQMSPMFVFISKDENIIDIRFGFIEESEFLKLLMEQSQK
jgi:thioredoxin-related protein